MKTLIGIDFSINKPAACILQLDINKYSFISWPYGISNNCLTSLGQLPISIISREDTKDTNNNISDKMRYEVNNSIYLSNLIISSFKFDLSNNTFIAFEGLSYGSKGDVVLQLGGYKYILMEKLSMYIPLDNMYTFAPITVKKTANCSKRGMNKADMIESFKKQPNEASLFLKENESLFKTNKGNWITHLDDIVDSFWIVETLKAHLRNLGSI